MLGDGQRNDSAAAARKIVAMVDGAAHHCRLVDNGLNLRAESIGTGAVTRLHH